MLTDKLGMWLASADRTSSDRLVFYYSGHGESVEDDAHYLIVRNTQFADGRLIPHTALPDDLLARMLAISRVQHALVMLDTCYSGRGITELSAKAGALLRKRSRDDKAAYGIYLVSASRPRERAAEYEFARTFVQAVANEDGQLGGTTQRFIDPDRVVRAMNQLLKRRGAHQRVQWLPATALQGDLAELIPNPLFAAARGPGLDLEEHWLAKALGSDVGSEAWYFTGRERALRELIAWLTLPAPDGKARVVTGNAGTGKSALLGRVVTLFDPAQRERLKAAGTLDSFPVDMIPPPARIVAVHARKKTLAEVVRAIGDAAGESISDAPKLIEVLRNRADPLTIVVDALDESEEPRKVSRDLLRNLAPLATVRLLVGSRPEQAGRTSAGSPRGMPHATSAADHPPGEPPRRVPSLGAAVVEIDLDDPDYLGPGDVEKYVWRRLLCEQEPDRRTPYRNQPELAREVAREVASRAGGVFLIARIVSRKLVEAEMTVDLTDPRRLPFPAEVGEAFDAYLDRFDTVPHGELNKRAVVDLLRPLAFAEGEGLPSDEVWAVIASALAGREYVDQDVATAVRLTGAYVVEGSEQGRSAYRLYHQALAEWLAVGAQDVETHARIVDALSAIVPRAACGGPDWLRAPPYVRTHLISHAARAGRVDELALDPLFLVAADPSRLLRALPAATSDDARQCAYIFEFVAHRLKSGTPEERLAYLELAARQHRGDVLLDRSRAISFTRPFQAAWARWAASASNRVLGEHSSNYAYVRTVDAGTGPLVLVSAGQVVCAYRVEDGAAVWGPFVNDLVSGLFGGLCLARVNGEQVVIGYTARGTAHLWPFRERAAARTWVAPGLHFIDALAVVEDRERTVAAIAGTRFRPSVDEEWPPEQRAEIQIWELSDSEPRLVNQIQTHALCGLAHLSYRGRSSLVAAGQDGVLRILDVETGALLGSFPSGLQGAHAFAVSTSEGTPCAVVAQGESIHVVSLLDEGCRLAHEPRAGHADGVTALDVGDFNGTPVFASTGRDNMVRVWRLADSELLFEALVGFAGVKPTGVALARSPSEASPVVITGDSHGKVRVWPCRAPAAVTRAEDRSAGYIEELCVIETGDGPRAITRDRQGILVTWDPTTGQMLPALGYDADRRYRSVSSGSANGHPLLVVCDHEGALRAWFADSGAPCGTPIALPHGGGSTLAASRGAERALVAVVMPDKSIGVYDLQQSALVGTTPALPTNVCVRVYHLLDGHPVVLVAGAPFQPVWVCAVGSDRVLEMAGGEIFTAATVATARSKTVMLAARVSGGLCLLDLATGRAEGSDPEHWRQRSLPAPAVTVLECRETAGKLIIATSTLRGQISVFEWDRLLASIATDSAPHALAILPPHGIVLAASEGLMLLKVDGLFSAE